MPCCQLSFSALEEASKITAQAGIISGYAIGVQQRALSFRILLCGAGQYAERDSIGRIFGRPADFASLTLRLSLTALAQLSHRTARVAARLQFPSSTSALLQDNPCPHV
jgi:5,10-methenyltetrahydromethanopterin hydrogenase